MIFFLISFFYIILAAIVQHLHNEGSNYITVINRMIVYGNEDFDK